MLLNLIIISLMTFFCVECISRLLPKPLIGFFQVLDKVLHVIGSDFISDHWKECVLLSYSARLFKYIIYLFFSLFIAFSPFIAALYIPFLKTNGLLQFLFSWLGIVFSSFVAIVYVYAKSKLNHNTTADSSSDYNLTSQILHRLVLGNRIVPLLLFKIERLIFFYKQSQCHQQPVFVCALARSGTTMLMRELYNTNQFVSLTYSNMPFVLSPNLWNKLSVGKHSQKQQKERSHGDGVLVSEDSPEALEEVFWKTFCAKDYFTFNGLAPHKPSQDVINKFKKYVGLVSAGKRYLSKNNNNILRIDSLRSTFPDAHILVPFRNPLTHANSLLVQHKRFVELSHQDSFIREYMDFLAHHEFGVNQKPFDFGKAKRYLDKNDINYWLELWLHCYEYLYSHYKTKVTFVGYESLCQPDSQVWKDLSELLCMPLPHNPERLRAAKQVDHHFADAALLDSCINLYDKLTTNDGRHQA